MGSSGSSVNKESACNVGDPSLIPGSGRSPGKGIGYVLQYSWTSLVAQMVKKSTCNVGDLASIPGVERSPGGSHVNPLQYSCLDSNPHGQRSPAACSPCDNKESDRTERLSTYTEVKEISSVVSRRMA